ncbi:MAG TPA: SLC26A/SulP transporter family protein [Bacteroidota bacterium]|nr:SLC26A/SulP transporter family protein [Bacteroidota bacterium]
MTESTSPAKDQTPVWIGDLWGGLAAMLVALPSSIAFGVLTYTVMGPEYAGVGAAAGMLGAAALGTIAPLFGRTRGLISAPCAPSAAVLSATVAGLLSGTVGHRLTPEAILPLLMLTGLVSALFQILYGALRGGRLIKFIPFPVVSGYLSGVAVLIAIGQLPKLLGFPKGIPLWEGLRSPQLWEWEGMVVGGMSILLMGLAPKITKKVPAAIIGLGGGIVSYLALSFFFPDLRMVTGNPLVIGPIQATGSITEVVARQIRAFLSVDMMSLRLIMVPALTLSVLLSVDTLKTCVTLDALTKQRHNSDRELIGQGIGNLASALVGGMPGAGTTGPTLVNVSSGGKTPRASVIEGVFVILAILLLGQLIAWVPIAALAGILLVIAWRMFDRSMFGLLRYPEGRLDFAVIAGVVIVSISVDLIAASGVGVAMAILLFIRDQIRGSVIRNKLYLNQISSKTRRRPSDREVLQKYGDQGVFCELQGNLFFGTTDQLFTMLEPDLQTKRFILLDMRRVLSMDYTAAHLFEQMHDRLAERNGQLLFSGMPSGLLDQRNFEHYLVKLGVVREGGGVMISETMDGALEWMEDRILESAGVVHKEEHLFDVTEFELFREVDQQTLDSLRRVLGERSYRPEETVFKQGDVGDEIFLVRRGAVRILLPLEGGKFHHLATIGQGDFFGELAFLDRGARSANAVTKVSTDLYVLSRARLNELSRSNPEFGVQIFARMAHAIALRLRQADAELRILQER